MSYIDGGGQLGSSIEGGDITLPLVLTNPVATSGSPVAFTLVEGAHTTLAASTEAPTMLIDASATKEWATGAITSQREFKFLAPTYGFVGASTITNAATVYISGAPASGTNATLTNTYALWIDNGAVQFDRDLTVGTTLSVASSSTLTGVVTCGDDVVSDTDSTDDLGTTGVRWANLWSDAITNTNLITTATLSVTSTSTLTGVTTHGGNVVSDTDSTDDLGTTSVRWANLWVDAITCGGLTATATLTASGTSNITGVATFGDDVVSDTDSTDDLGTTSVRWANLFVDDITVTASVTATAIGNGSGSALRAVSTDPALEIRETDAALNEKSWDIAGGSGNLSFRAINDANSSASTYMLVERTGTTIDTVTITATDITVSGLLGATVVTGTASGAGSASALRSVSTGPAIELRETDAASNEKSWDIAAGSGGLIYRTVSDDNLSASTYMQVDRTGITVDTVTLTATNITVSGVLNCDEFKPTDDITMADAKDINLNTTTGTVIGSGATQKLAFWAATPVVQPGHIADPTGGATVDTECRAQLALVLADLAELGLQAAS